MKSLFVILTSVLLLMGSLQITYAQTKKGSWLLSGSGSFEHSKIQYGTKHSTFQFSPKGGLFISNNLAVGLKPSLSITSSPATGSTNRLTSYNLSIGPFVRYYFPISSSMSLFAEGSFSYGTSFQRPKMEMEAASTYAWEIGPGAALFISPSVSLDLAVKYGQYHYNGSSEIKTNSTVVQFGFSIYLP